ncbi:hypothetical protein COT72_04190 [archaeon CG10_big_fil_rev_8_21_14_0_10_43_11]|nr:MAG: hypothetical protein COT72_04190 [archaeon CG10_big_fil_rev_8_21_14_0_10_43_11]
MFDELALLEALTRKRVELMREIAHCKPSSIRDLAEALDRDVKNVWQDLSILEDFGLVGFKQKGRTKRPFITRQVIVTTIQVVYHE